MLPLGQRAIGTEAVNGREVVRVGNELSGLPVGRERGAARSRAVVTGAGDGIQQEDSQDAQGLRRSPREYAPGCTARQSTRAEQNTVRGEAAGVPRPPVRAVWHAQGAPSPNLSQVACNPLLRYYVNTARLTALL